MLQIAVIKVGLQGPAGPQGLQGIPGSDASVTTANVLAALGIPTYAGMAAANAALNIGDLFRDSSDGNKLKIATA